MRHGRCECAPARWRAVTLLELLVVVSIIGALMALVLPAVQAAREAARRGQCQHHLRQLGIAAITHESRSAALPIGCVGCRLSLVPGGGPPAPQRFIAWNVNILPLMELPQLWDRFDYSKPSYWPANKEVGAAIVDEFLCPSTAEEALRQPTGLWKGTAFTDYAGIYGVEGEGRTATNANAAQWLLADSLGVMLYEQPVASREIVDGLSRTAMIAETLLRRQIESEWVNGHNVFAQEQSTRINHPSGIGNDIGSPHPGGAALVFCDGHVAFVSETIEQRVLISLLTKAGGEL
jgi:prepilin-type processing-associated H-X9-DG protein